MGRQEILRKGISVIHVSKNRLDQIQYLIHQSIQGNHVLFDPDTLRRVLRTEPGQAFWRPLSEAESYSVEHHIERLIELPTLSQKRAYLETLDSRTYAWVVKTYFTIIENNLYESQEGFH